MREVCRSLTHCWDAPLCCGVVVVEEDVCWKVPFDDVEEPLVEPQLELAAPNAAWAVDNAPSTCCWPDATA